jgi:predicted ATP-dependent serine protease
MSYESNLLLSSPIWLLMTAGCSISSNENFENEFICPTLGSVKEVIQQISSIVAPKPRTALDLHRAELVLTNGNYDTIERWFLKTGVRDLDKVMGGGLSSKFITEISGSTSYLAYDITVSFKQINILGPPGIGKTQFCLTTVLLALTNSNPQLTDFTPTSSIIYIDTVRLLHCTNILIVLTCEINIQELKLDPGRLVQMAMHRYPEIYGTNKEMSTQHKALDALLNRVKV